MSHICYSTALSECGRRVNRNLGVSRSLSYSSILFVQHLVHCVYLICLLDGGMVTRLQGDLTDPLYFDFISFAQYSTVSTSIPKGLQVFKVCTAALLGI